jgi:cytochrome b561
MAAHRLTWRLTNATLPPFRSTMTKLHRATVKLSEYGLYALPLALPVTGLLTTIFGGRPFALFLWRFPPLAARDETLRAPGEELSQTIGRGRRGRRRRAQTN